MSFKSDLNLTIGVLGTNVPRSSQSITWRDGHKTVLPTVYDEFMLNICDHVDIPLVKYMAKLKPCESNSNHVLHLSGDTLHTIDAMAIVSQALCINRCVLIKGVPYNKPRDGLTIQYLDEQVGISPLRPVQIHGIIYFSCSFSYWLTNIVDIQARYNDHTDPIVFGNMRSFMESMNDTNKIQSILDIPLAQTTLPECLRQVITFL